MKRNSLSHLLLRQLLPSIGVVLLLGAALGYWIALRSATLAYDRALLDANEAVAGQISLNNRELALHLPEVAQRVLVADAFDTIYFEVVGLDGRRIGGNAILPRSRTAADHMPVFYDGEYEHTPIRLAATQFETAGTGFLVISAETMVKRNKLVQEILVAMLLPGLLLASACAVLVYRGTRKGLAGIPRLRDELAHRSQADLRPLPLDEVPEELAPLIAETNELLLRLAGSLERQRNFVADASHQLRTPIAALMVEAEQALKTADPRAELNNIVAGAHRLGRLAHQLLTLSRIEPGHISTFGEVELSQLVTQEADRWLKPAKLKQIDLGFDLAQVSILGDAFWLEELINNLADNAIRYTPLHGMVTVRCGAALGSAWLEVEDNGPGIPEEERNRIFERFHRLHSTDTTGCGLGLAIVKEIAQAHHAEISIKDGSQHGGTLVRISFPPRTAGQHEARHAAKTHSD